MNNYETAFNRRNRKRAEANQRLAARSKLTNKQQLARLDKRSGNAKRERARLAA